MAAGLVKIDVADRSVRTVEVTRLGEEATRGATTRTTMIVTTREEEITRTIREEQMGIIDTVTNSSRRQLW